MLDLYETLGVPPTATLSQIKKAYRSKSAEHHPDHGGDAKQFAAIALAYEVLSDPDKRARYDAGEPVDDLPGMEPEIMIVNEAFDEVVLFQPHGDLVKGVRDFIAAKKRKLQIDHKKAAAVLQRLNDRLELLREQNAADKNPAGLEVLEAWFLRKISEATAMQDEIQRQIDVHGGAIGVVEYLVCKVKPPVRLPFAGRLDGMTFDL